MDTVRPLDPIITGRLYLRKLEPADCEAFFAYRSLPEVYKFQSFKPQNAKDAARFISSISEYPNIPNTWFQLAVCRKNNNQLIGDIGIHFLEDEAQVEAGYTIAPEFQGQGYATESLRAVFDYIFSVRNKHKIIASVDPNNDKSVRLLERLGMSKEAHFTGSINANGACMDDCVYAMLRETWNNRDTGDKIQG